MKNLARAAFVTAVLALSPLVAFGGVTQIDTNPDNRIQLLSDPEGAMRQARERVAAGDLPGAIKQLATYVAGHAGEYGPKRLLGDLYYREGDLGKAESTYQQILVLVPKDRETHARLGAVYATENRVDDAINEFERSLPGTDSVPDLVLLHERRGDLDEYQAEKETIATNNPSDPEAQLELAKVYGSTHRTSLAVVYYQRALDDDPDNVIALSGLGVAYMDEHRYKDAQDTFQLCLRNDSLNYSCLDNRGAAYLESKDWEKAEAALQHAHQLEPERSEAIVNLGYLANARGDWKGAINEYLRALSVNPYSVDAYIDLGYTYDVHQLYALAQSVLIKGLSVSPLDGRLHYLLAQAYEDQNQDDLATAQFRQAAKSDDPEVQRAANQRLTSLQALAPHA